MAIQNVAEIRAKLEGMSPLQRAQAEAYLNSRTAGDPLGVDAKLVEQAKDTYAAGAAKAKGVDIEAQEAKSGDLSTASPHSPYGQKGAWAAGETYYVPIESEGIQLTSKTGARLISGKELGRIMEEKGDQWKTDANPEGYRFFETRKGLIERNGLVPSADGKSWLVPMKAGPAGAFGNHAPGMGSSDGAMTGEVGQSIMNNLERSGFVMPFMGDGADVESLGGAFVAGGALSKISDAGGGLKMAAHAMGMDAGTLATVGAVSGTAMTVARAFGLSTDGLEHNMRAIMNSHIREFKMDSLTHMVDNPNIPIEDLIFYFMAAMTDQYDKKLREKMRESAIAEKLEERRNRREREADMAAGMAQGVGAMFGPVGGIIGGMVGHGFTSAAMKMNELEAGLNGKIKSSTTLASEVQMLTNKWKQLNEMMSNLLKLMHDMAMTPIRNIR